MDKKALQSRLFESWKKLKNDGFFQSFKGVVVSCSGGVDSTALFELIWRFFKDEKNFSVALFHCHYGLRGEESDLDLKFLQDQSVLKQVTIFTKIVTEDMRAARSGESLQEWARRLRRADYCQLAQENWLIALAHQQDDLAENTLLRMARGAAIGALAGMEVYKPPFWRPLLDIPKHELIKFLQDEGLTHRHDASNDKLDYSRNIVRHKLLPELEALFPGAKARIAQCAQEAQELSQLSQQALAATRPSHGLAAWLISLPPAAARSALAQLIADHNKRPSQNGLLGPQQRPLSRRFLDQILVAAKQRVGTDKAAQSRYTRQIPGGGRVTVHGRDLLLEAAEEP